ncbi:hypothetical protein [Candidatus Korobacter versatilis]|nr:hypothetical protein [Candidatus Koribacter versatilis]
MRISSTLARVCQFLVLLCLLAPLCMIGAENVSQQNGLQLADAPRSLFPLVARGGGSEIRYIGAIFADGKFRVGAFASANAQEHANLYDGTTPLSRPADVPPAVELHPREQARENLSAKNTAQKSAAGRSEIVGLLDEVVTAVYGREQSLMGPTSVTTDRDGRVIVSDPAALSVHVFDPMRPFRILAGTQYRLQHIGPVATDAVRNIYVADPVQGVVVEFDREGRYLGEIGRLGEGEGIFHEPVAMAVDVHHFLYVADAERDMVLMVNSEGKILRRAGGRRKELGVSLEHPSALVLKHDQLFVLDANDTRVQVFDSQLRRRMTFDTGLGPGHRTLDLDTAGNIYVSDGRTIYIFDGEGHRKGEFGRKGSLRGEISSVAGLWIDENDRMYVTDKENRRVAVFQIKMLEDTAH